ncbi:MAG: hypothetical protein DMG96_29505 [Acidobacteria bacterium]|nr:MAG: hypothetical protein DMG96_29505 [Acidobacteriota bacterium]
MKSKYNLIAFAFLTIAALGQTETTPSPAPQAFETPGRVPTKMFMPAELMSGPLHSVGDFAENDGMNNTYFLYSGDDAWAVTTGIALRTRIREIYAIAKLREMSKTDEFARAMANAGKQKIEGVVGIVTNPLGTIQNIPLGASRFFGRIGEAMKGGTTQGEGNAVQNMIGVSKAKVALAVKLGVSPYSYNQELQTQLTSNARAMALGGLVVSAATAAVGGPAGDVLTGLNVNQTLQQTLVNSTPDDLRIINRKKLFALKVSRENADAILMHPWYSPWTETIMIDALSTIGVDPTAFLADACNALTEEDAIFFERLAQVLARYDTTKAQLRSIRVESHAVCALDANGTLVFPLSCDYAIWSEHAAGRVAEFAALTQGQEDIKGLAVWVDGKVSDRAAQELKSRKIDLVTAVLDKR